MTYDNHNIFARILRGELPCQKVGENEHYLAFHDLYPRAPIHVLILPKGPYCNAFDFHDQATPEEIVGFYKGVNSTIESFNLSEGYRLISNTGYHGGQDVSHYHIHLLAGQKLNKHSIV